MSFETIIAKDERGLLRLKQLYIKLYFSTEHKLRPDDVKVNRNDPILVECVKSLLKNRESFRNSFELWSVPAEYMDRISIGTKDVFEHLIIQDKKDGDPEPKLVSVLRSRTIAMSIHDSAHRRSHFKPKNAFSGIWDRKARAPAMAPIYCDDDDL